MRVFSMLWVLPLFLAGCGDKSAVSLSAHITNGVVTVDNGTFGASASGSFKLRLALGPEASASVKVTPQAFQLLGQANVLVVDQLPVTTSSPSTITIDKGGNQDVEFAFTGAMVDHDAACAGPLTFVGALDDSSGNSSYPVASGPVTPSCD
ncbi:MAG: hypothetical protein ABI548_11105 [Polyangiaceae bacterium]